MVLLSVTESLSNPHLWSLPDATSDSTDDSEAPLCPPRRRRPSRPPAIVTWMPFKSLYSSDSCSMWISSDHLKNMSWVGLSSSSYSIKMSFRKIFLFYFGLRFVQCLLRSQLPKNWIPRQVCNFWISSEQFIYGLYYLLFSNFHDQLIFLVCLLLQIDLLWHHQQSTTMLIVRLIGQSQWLLL